MDYGLEDYDLFDDQPSAFARWALPALIISLLLHALLFIGLRHLPIHPIPETPPKKIVITQFKLQPVDPRIFEPVKNGKKQAAAAPEAVNLPTEKPSLGAMQHPEQGAPAAPKIDHPLLAEKPKVTATTYEQTVKAAEQGGVKSVAGEIDQVRRDLLAEKPGVSGKPLLEMAPPDIDAGGAPAKQGQFAGSSTPGFSNLDQLLAQTGPLTPETAPIRMDADVLFTYDSYQLQPGALDSLRKLATLVQRNPQLVFSIEGHTDSSGDATYNIQLSEYRAEAVKQALVNMSIDPAILSTRGYGDTRLVVPATHPFDEAAEGPNRRVEIVLHDRNPQTPPQPQ
jgi:outer membrane protein OmpA-like peptidoglycan-associated protein